MSPSCAVRWTFTVETSMSSCAQRGTHVKSRAKAGAPRAVRTVTHQVHRGRLSSAGLLRRIRPREEEEGGSRRDAADKGRHGWPRLQEPVPLDSQEPGRWRHGKHRLSMLDLGLLFSRDLKNAPQNLDSSIVLYTRQIAY